jgi:hypothetical protein
VLLLRGFGRLLENPTNVVVFNLNINCHYLIEKVE